ncbi:hypothetical protein PG997_008726 [Apiospora hydei]|uniref:Uncharacterized protein n=1 Tax=Apiospora hydei TaxID=1337664 RepID=A0ABR1WBM7_9PEZI
MLFILFFALAIIPACIGFARYWGMGDEEGAIGLSTDADFMWLIAGNLLALLGNLFAILPLFKLTRGSLKYVLTQAGLWLSVALGGRVDRIVLLLEQVLELADVVLQQLFRYRRGVLLYPACWQSEHA